MTDPMDERLAELRWIAEILRQNKARADVMQRMARQTLAEKRTVTECITEVVLWGLAAAATVFMLSVLIGG